MKPTITSLALHVGKSRQQLQNIKKKNPVYFDIIWRGWLDYCKKISVTERS